MTEEHIRRVGRIEIGGRYLRHEYRGHAWSYTQYQDAVESQLTLLQQSQTANIVLNSITRRLLIVPWQDQRIDPNIDNAEARPMSERFLGYIPDSLPQNNRDATMYGQWVRDPDEGHTDVQRDSRRRQGVGTGRGSAVVIEYTPGMWIPGDVNATQQAGPTRAQELLLHELVHAIRQMRGLADTRAIPNYDYRDEFHAILVTNIYRSERRISPLRRDHQGFQPLLNPSQFYSQTRNKLLVMDLCREMRIFTRALAKVNSRFNPIREYYQEMRII